MSIQPLIFKNGVYTLPKSSTDVSALLATLGLNNVNNTSDLNKPISTATQTALDLKANLISPSFNGTPTAPTATVGTNTTQVANCAFVSTAISNLVASSPAALDTLNELAAALGNDANFSTTVTNSLANKVNKTGDETITGIKTFSSGLILPSSSGSSVSSIWRNTDNLEYKDSTNTTRVVLNNAGNLSNLSNKQTALNNLVGTQTANRVLRSDGTNVTLSQVNLSTDVINTLPLNLGGTGQTTAQLAINSLAGGVTSGSYLRGNGTNVVMSTIQASDVPTLNQNTTGTASNVTGIVLVANGGTGSSTQNFVDLTTNQTVGGNKTLSSVVIVPNTSYGFNIDPVSDTYNTCRFTASDSSYWDFGVSPVSAGKVFYISSGTAGGGINGFQINASNYNISTSGILTVTNTTASTSSTTGSGKFAGGIGVVGKGCFGGGLNLSNLPTSSSGLTTGDVWRNGNILTIV